MEEKQKLFEIEKEKELYEAKVEFFTEIAHEAVSYTHLVAGSEYTDIPGFRFELDEPLVGPEPEIMIFIFQYFISYIVR